MTYGPMHKRTPDQLRYWSETNKIIGHQLRAYYQACTTEELPPRLVATLKKLDEEIEPSAEQVEAIRDIVS
jgi:hypothetical protein